MHFSIRGNNMAEKTNIIPTQTPKYKPSARIKVNLSGTAETMLQSFYARAKYSNNKGHKFYDSKAVEIVEKIDYDFSLAEGDSTISDGVIARTLVFDELVKNFISENPNCTVVNIACGLDTRFYRMDNGRLKWINLDLPEIIDIRNEIFDEPERILNIGCSVLDASWVKNIDACEKVLFIIEGLSMYLTKNENAKMLEIIRKNFSGATVMLECLAKRWINREKIEKSIHKTGARFIFGADCFEDIADIAAGFRKIKDDNITRGMIALHPVLRLFEKLPFVDKISEKILIFESE